MAYYLMVEKKKGEYQSLNVDKILNFPGKKRYTKAGAYSLQEIDLFTTMFNDIVELKKTLVLDGVLPVELVNKALSIRWVNKGKYNKVPYDFLYQKDIEYLFEPTKLIELIMKKFYQKDFVFIRKFADFFSGYRECSATAPEVRMYADISIRENITYHHFYDVDKNGDNQIKRLIKLLLIEYFEKEDGYIVYKDKINYRNLHTMIAFVNNYDNKDKKKENTDIREQINLAEVSAKTEIVEATQMRIFDDVENPVISNSAVKKRVKKKKNQEIEGQLSFEDLL